jgi:4-amino-4-deoxy-L-arabinose transferase-like glycosyltransferase
VSRVDRIALLVLATLTALHVVYGGLIALSPQEAYYWSWSRRLDLSYFDHPPLAAWTIAAATALFGDGERAIRLAAAFHSFLFLAFFWLAVRRLFGSRAALLALAAGLTVPLVSLGQVIITPDGPLLSGWTMALYFTVRALDEERPAWLLATGGAIGWAILGKYTGFLLFPQVLLVLLLDPRGRRMLRTPWPWLGVGLALLMFSPVVAWNLERAGASFLFQTEDRVRRSGFTPKLVGKFLGLQAVIVTPVVLLLLFDGIVQALRRWRRPEWLVCGAFAAPLLLLAVSISPFLWVKSNWLAPAYPTALAAAAALGLERRGWRRVAGVGGLGLALAATAYFHLAFLVPALPFPARDDFSAGWRELATRVEAERAALGGDAFVAGCGYKTSSELGYYLPGRPRTWSSEIAGGNGLQYRYWFAPEELEGRTGIVVSDRRERRNTCARLEEACQPLVPLATLEVKRGADTVTVFKLWRCRYLGPRRIGAG